MAISGKRESTMRRKICAARGLIFLLLLTVDAPAR